MKNKEIGITLIALVVTIVITVLLAAITIGALINNGFIKVAINSGENYAKTAKAEEDELAKAMEMYSSIKIADNDDAVLENISVKTLKELIRQEIEKSGEGSNPTGAVISQMGNSAPDGYLVCDGAEYNINEYKTLAEYIKAQFGSYNYWGGDGITTFAVPNLQGEFLRGYSKSETESKMSGITTPSVGAHQEGSSVPLVNLRVNANGSGGLLWFDGVAKSVNNDYCSDNVDKYINETSNMYQISFNSTDSYRNTWASGVRSLTVLRPTNTTVLYCIKY